MEFLTPDLVLGLLEKYSWGAYVMMSMSAVGSLSVMLRAWAEKTESTNDDALVAKLQTTAILGWFLGFCEKLSLIKKK